MTGHRTRTRLQTWTCNLIFVWQATLNQQLRICFRRRLRGTNPSVASVIPHQLVIEINIIRKLLINVKFLFFFYYALTLQVFKISLGSKTGADFTSTNWEIDRHIVGLSVCIWIHYNFSFLKIFSFPFFPFLKILLFPFAIFRCHLKYFKINV